MALITFMVGLFFLILFYINQEPISSDKFQEFIGDFVTTKATVVEISKTRNNNTKLLACDNYSCFYIIDLKDAFYDLGCNDIIVYGKLEYYMGNYYLFVFDKRDIKCI